MVYSSSMAAVTSRARTLYKHSEHSWEYSNSAQVFCVQDPGQDGVKEAETHFFLLMIVLGSSSLLLKKMHVMGFNVSTGEAAIISMERNLTALVSKVLWETTVIKVKALDNCSDRLLTIPAERRNTAITKLLKAISYSLLAMNGISIGFLLLWQLTIIGWGWAWYWELKVISSQHCAVSASQCSRVSLDVNRYEPLTL